MPLVRPIWLVTVTATLLSLPACPRDAPDTLNRATLLDRSQGLEISRTAARQYGYDQANYELDTFGDPVSDDGQTWRFLYRARPQDGGYGRHFLVVVDRRSHEAEVFPGE
ncbi:hypothetical protein [Marilutibacter maris]|uniref:Uncharacterized protein n=1 Tax=Marilutibacter maris TaxID=1605891 RepID=A0A2U9TA51_9GAMM|nr:hypothetical protein [Lysobacter maris]AWV07764.1 hypothetical protein C9I47_2081 [Lysobacter maris]